MTGRDAIRKAMATSKAAQAVGLDLHVIPADEGEGHISGYTLERGGELVWYGTRLPTKDEILAAARA